MMVIEKRNLDEQIVDWIRTGILERKYVPGSILKDTEIAEETGVSRSTARTALQRLTNERLVTQRTHGGWEIAPLSREDADEIYSLRNALECMAVRIVTARLDDHGRALIRQSLEDLKRVIGSGNRRKIAEADLAIHECIVGLTGHGRLIHHFRLLLQPTLIYVMFTNAKVGHNDEIVDLHQMLVDAICAGDTERAVEITRKHIVDGQAWMVESLGRPANQASD